MADDSESNETTKEERILEGWERFASEHQFSGLSDEEKARFEQKQFAEERASKTSFVLGEPICHKY